MTTPSKPLIIAGPCVAESFELMEIVASKVHKLAGELGFDYVFKASFDKANRTAVDSYRGPGLDTGLEWLEKIKSKFKIPVLTDIHECAHVAKVSQVCDYLQIPAFLCRQTDLVVEAAKTGRVVNIKKGQFMAPGAMHHIVEKARHVTKSQNLPDRVMLTERGASFGYGNLVVDMRAFAIMAASRVPILFDITHSTQLPPTGGEGSKSSGGQRSFAPLLARSATATGYLDGYFLEVHPNPAQAKSDKDAQLDLQQAELLLRQLVPLWHASRELNRIDAQF